MERGLIITLPRYDDVTEYLSQFSDRIIEEADKRGIPVKKLKDKAANKKDFEKTANRLKYKLIVFNGHGSDTTIAGYKDEPLVGAGLNESILYDKITYARSCRAAAILGKCLENKEGGCFIGYNVDFMFYTDDRWSSNPIKDVVARLFLEPSNVVPISILKGNDASTANNNSRNQILKGINKVIREKSAESFLVAQALWNNYTGQVILGNGEARL